jgi:protein-S-isoprenylcysteine O-methyltransferase Ste14
MLSLLSMILLADYLDRLLQIPWLIPQLVSRIIGLLLLMSGALLTSRCVFLFIKAKGTPVPLNPPPTIVRSGPYRYVRNPMLSGVFMLMFGTGFILESPALIFVFTPLFILINILELKYIEEPELEKRLGAVYSEYRQSTPMFIPRIRKINSQ